jgi:cytochrome c oxidase subunit 3
MIEQSNLSKEEELRIKERSEMLLLWLGIASIIMIFAGLTSAYVVRQAEGNWWYFDMPSLFYVNTAVIIVSSLTFIFATRYASKNDFSKTNMFLLITLLLGLVFVFIQFKAWGVLVEGGIFFTGAESNAAGSYLYVLSGVHLAHIFVGLISLFWVTIKSYNGAYTVDKHNGIKLVALFWHFLGILWIYLFGFLIFIR